MLSTVTNYYTANEKREALIILMEEASEVIQEASKQLRTGPDFCRKGSDIPNMVYFQQEVMDFMILLEIAEELGVYKSPSAEVEDEYSRYKMEKLKNWSGLIHVVQRIQERNPTKYNPDLVVRSPS